MLTHSRGCRERLARGIHTLPKTVPTFKSTEGNCSVCFLPGSVVWHLLWRSGSFLQRFRHQVYAFLLTTQAALHKSCFCWRGQLFLQTFIVHARQEAVPLLVESASEQGLSSRLPISTVRDVPKTSARASDEPLTSKRVCYLASMTRHLIELPKVANGLCP